MNWWATFITGGPKIKRGPTESANTTSYILNSLSQELLVARQRLASLRRQPESEYGVIAHHLETLADMFDRTSRDQHRELAAEFHDCAGCLPYVGDADFGSLVLEHAAGTVQDPALRSFLLAEAVFRARWCVRAATGGAESIARGARLARLEQALAGLQ
jgi:hypothetical protein